MLRIMVGSGVWGQNQILMGSEKIHFDNVSFSYLQKAGKIKCYIIGCNCDPLNLLLDIIIMAKPKGTQELKR